MKYIIIALCAFVAVAHAQLEDPAYDYIDKNQDQYDPIVDGYDKVLLNFKLNNTGLIEAAVSPQKVVINDTLGYTKTYATPLTVVNNFVERCVKENRKIAEKSVYVCQALAYTHLKQSLDGATGVRNDLEIYIERDFKNELMQYSTYSGATLNGVLAMFSKADEIVKENQNLFEIKLQEAERLVKINLQSVTDCVSDIDDKAITECLKSYIQQLENTTT